MTFSKLFAVAATLSLLVGCSEDSDARARHNEVHITIHQKPSSDKPLIGWAVENGTPEKNDFKADVRFLELSVLGNSPHPTTCAITIDHAVIEQTDEDPSAEDTSLLSGANTTTEHSYTTPCSETPDSTRIAWPDGSILMTGHIADASDDSGDDSSSTTNSWTFEIDDIKTTPSITKFDPDDSFTWTTPSPKAT